MSIEFENAILAGVTLIREAIQSQNFQAGVAGWQIKADGTAEFADLVIRSSDGSGSTVVIANGVITIQDGAGNTVVRIDATGYTLYNASGAIVAQIQLDQGQSLGGFYCRGFQFPENIAAFLYGGGVVSSPVTPGVVALNGFLEYTCAPTATPPYTVQTLSTGAIDMALDDEARIQLISERGQRPKIWADGGSSAVPADLISAGDVIASEDFVASTGATLGRGNTKTQFLTTTVSGVTAEAVTMTMAGVVFQPGRAYRLTLHCSGTSTVAGDRIQYRVRKTGLGGTVYLDALVAVVVAAASISQYVHDSNIIVNNSGSTLTQTLTATTARQAGTGGVTFGASVATPAYLQVEDIGPSTDYVNATAITP